MAIFWSQRGRNVMVLVITCHLMEVGTTQWAVFDCGNVLVVQNVIDCRSANQLFSVFWFLFEACPCRPKQNKVSTTRFTESRIPSPLDAYGVDDMGCAQSRKRTRTVHKGNNAQGQRICDMVLH